MSATIESIEATLREIKDLAQQLLQRVVVSGQQVHVPSGISEISNHLGVMTAGEFRTGINEPNYGFSGVRMRYPSMTYNAQEWNLVGINNDVLQFGLSATDGKALAGAGNVILDATGANIIASVSDPADWASNNSLDFLNPSTLLRQFSLWSNYKAADDLIRTYLSDAQSGAPYSYAKKSIVEISAHSNTVAGGFGEAAMRASSNDADANYVAKLELHSGSSGADNNPYALLLATGTNGTIQMQAAKYQIRGYDGWIDANATWTYASATSFTVPGDLTAVFTPGLKVKWKQTTVKYGHVASSSYGAPNTTVNLIANSDYSVANATITENYYSFDDYPIGFPDWFNWAPSFTGFSSNPANGVYRFRISGRAVLVNIAQPSDGTSNATTFSISAPIAAKTVTNGLWFTPGIGRDNGANLATPIEGGIVSAGTVFNFYKDCAGAGWTNPGGKRVSAWQLVYEI